MIKKLALCSTFCLLFSFKVTSVEDYYRLSDPQKRGLIYLFIENQQDNLKKMIDQRVCQGMQYDDASWQSKSEYISMLYHMMQIKEEMHGKTLNLHEIEDQDDS